jgi:DNA-directed RNA polymerase subunit N (RpoN/RPB10)
MFPVRCYTCGAPIGHKRRAYLEKATKHRQDKMTYYTGEGPPTMSFEGHLMQELKITKPCCKRHMLTSV